MMKPRMNADFSSESTNAGMSEVSGTSSRTTGVSVCRRVEEHLEFGLRGS